MFYTGPIITRCHFPPNKETPKMTPKKEVIDWTKPLYPTKNSRYKVFRYLGTINRSEHYKHAPHVCAVVEANAYYGPYEKIVYYTDHGYDESEGSQRVTNIPPLKDIDWDNIKFTKPDRFSGRNITTINENGKNIHLIELMFVKSKNASIISFDDNGELLDNSFTDSYIRHSYLHYRSEIKIDRS